MFELSQDTIATDSVSFFLKKELPLSVDTARKGFSDFEFLSTDTTHLFFSQDTAKVLAEQSLHAGHQGLAFPFPPWLTSVFFLFFLFCFVLFSLIMHREESALLGNFKNIFQFGIRTKSAYKEQITATEIWGEVFLTIQAILLFSIIVFLYFWEESISILAVENYLVVFGGIFLLFAVFWGLKYIVYKIIGLILIPSDMNVWIGRYFRMIEFMGVLSFLPTMFLIYKSKFTFAATIVLAFLFIVSRIVIFWSSLSIFVKHKIGFLYFIVYLCGVEIIPYFLLYKGVVFLIKLVGNIVL